MSTPPATLRRRVLADRSVTTKIAASLCTASAVAVGVGVFGVAGMQQLNDDLDTVNTQHVAGMQEIATVRGDIASIYRAEFLQGVASTDSTNSDAAKAADANIDEALTRYVADTTSTDARAAVEDLRAALADYAAVRDVVVFRLAPPAGFVMPANDQIGSRFQDAEERFNVAVTALQEAETKQAAAKAAEATTQARHARYVVAGVLVGGLTVAVALGAYVIRTIRRQLVTVAASLTSVAAGDLTVPAQIHSRDELGTMAQAVNGARDGIANLVQQLSASAVTLNGSSRRLNDITTGIAVSAAQAAEQADTVAHSAADISTSVQAVASGAQEMGMSIHEISQNANDAARVAQQAVAAAAATTETVSKLGESSSQIGNVVKVITAIAEQTNLLALNATIEAARAGEMGKGFAVVAGEVKELAQQTAQATEDISRRVQAIQADTGDAVDAIADITRIVSTISDYQGTIASAVEEQTATTATMSGSVGEAAAGAADIASTIGGVAEATRGTSASVAEGQETARELQELSSQMTQLVGRFRV